MGPLTRSRFQGPPYRWPTIAKTPTAPVVDPQPPACGCIPGSLLRLAPPWTRSILSPKSAARRNYASSPRTPGPSESRSCPSYTLLPAIPRTSVGSKSACTRDPALDAPPRPGTASAPPVGETPPPSVPSVAHTTPSFGTLGYTPSDICTPTSY